jgi:hypothetical protein
MAGPDDGAPLEDTETLFARKARPTPRARRHGLSQESRGDLEQPQYRTTEPSAMKSMERRRPREVVPIRTDDAPPA